jgi:serine phosphatase RsbU (regulator of sigma subunit)
MVRASAKNGGKEWAEVILEPNHEFIRDISHNWVENKTIFINKIAENIYNDLSRTQQLFTSPVILKKEFGKLTPEEKSFWYDYASRIPGKLKQLNLRIRPYRDFCRTCLISYNEIEKVARNDYEYFCRIHSTDNPPAGIKKVYNKLPVSFKKLPDKRKRFFIELNHLIPFELKKIGYEIVRAEEISEIDGKVVKKIAKAIHSRYLHEIKKQKKGNKKALTTLGFFNPGNSGSSYLQDFDDLTEEIRLSNLDNAYHIPTKLLSVGYKIRHAEKGFRPAAIHFNDEEIETMARVEHIRWCWDKILNGWLYGKTKDSINKTHPSIIPYDDLSESEKEKDRELVRLIPALLKDIDYEVYPVNPNRLNKLPYVIKPQSSIHRILDETREMNDQIRKQVKITPEMEGMIGIRNRKIEEAIKEIEGSYNYARHIQETFLPEDLFVRECFAESFVFFRPKDIVSGDFYFFSKQKDLIIFAAADCTGHGIPGALLSTVSYGILDQAVNELKLEEPADILYHLYSKIHRFLRNDESGTGMPDDMDIALCVLNTSTNELTFAGVRNPLYRITGGELLEYKAKNQRGNCSEEGKCSFQSEKIKLCPGDAIYLFSDGFIDQFGGKQHKKYQSNRFKSFLTNIKDYSMPEQSDMLFEETEQWREENNEDQTDDILVIGVRI